ncbi:MAG: helix-turn-helix domain-containing protein [Tannerellaceae bacterium]|jgi:hypothetical protein|nr:helix-turn-helix domain-containing protein [Tannerellaceae bacterium]
MEVITVESQVFKDLVAKINMIAKFVVEHQKREDEESTEGWVDSYEICTFLKISAKTLQRLRSQRLINYSKIRGKNFYRLSEVSRLLNEHIIRSGDECLQDLIKNHKLHFEQRRNIKTDR